VEREQAQAEATGLARARSGADGTSAQSGLARNGTLPLQEGSPLSLQATAGNRAFAGLVQRWRRRDQAVQRTFDHKGRRRVATTYGPKAALPTIQGVSATELRLLADDAHDYKAIENKQQFDVAWAAYQLSHTKQAEIVPLDEEQTGNVTVHNVAAVEQTLFAGTVRMTLQLDWLQGKHDGPFMAKNAEGERRKMGDNQMRRSLGQYQALARGAPLELAGARLADIFAKPERAKLDFSVMGTKQSDGLYYEISATWATTAPGARHVLVYYHCFPDEKDQKKFGFG